MSEVVIDVKGLGKKYDLFQQSHGSYLTLRDQLAKSVRALGQSIYHPKANGAAAREAFWALKDVSFEIKQGEVVGIIGRNGAGKSTLLKILSRITEPTTGRIEISSQVASLLEVGTGFHAELTGRENIYLNGAILGMSRLEIKKRFDEIVSFSEVERFLDTPVKRYSSGMQVRLAFAVAAHLEPEILIVDEVLAVGDAAFQKKCLGKMSAVATTEGRTVLFVSHNMSAVQSLCPRALWLNGGSLERQGPTQQIVQDYLQSVFVQQETPLAARQDRGGDGSVRLTSVRIESIDSGASIRSGSCLKITIQYRAQAPLTDASFTVSIYDYTSSQGLFRLDSDGTHGIHKTLPAEGSVVCITDPIRLTAGRCFVNLRVQKGLVDSDYVQYAAFFDVEPENLDGTRKLPERDWMMTLVQHRWQSGDNLWNP